VVTGKPVSVGGTLGRTEATGHGVAIIAREALQRRNKAINGATVSIQGAGNVGAYAARWLHKLGAKIIAISDTSSALYNRDGLKVDTVLRHKEAGNPLSSYRGDAEHMPSEAVLELPCDVLVPAALENQLTAANASRVQAALVVEGANGPTTPEAEAVLLEKGITLVPDILANAGGVAVSYFEWVQDLQFHFWELEEVERRLEKIMTKAFAEVTGRAGHDRVPLRMAAYLLAIERVAEAMKLRGVFP
jgi:glutamate dehydrogenase (NAD(P)+)